jgi:hypothetical protein
LDHLVDIHGDAGAYLARRRRLTRDQGSFDEARAGLARPARGQRRVEHRTDPPRIDLLGTVLRVVVRLNTLESSPDPHTDDSDPVVRDQHITRVQHQVVHTFGRGCGECTRHLTADLNRLVRRKRSVGQQFSEGRPTKPSSHDQYAIVVQVGVDDAKDGWVFDSGGSLSRCPDLRRPWMTFVQDQDTDRAIKDDVVSAPKGAAITAGDLFEQVIASDEAFHVYEGTGRFRHG